jgi:hypothetical protein
VTTVAANVSVPAPRSDERQGVTEPVPTPRIAGRAVPRAEELDFKFVCRAAQDVVQTASRGAQPRAWLTAVEWLVASGLHPKANATTRYLAEDLAHRMDYRRGIVLYDLGGTARRLRVSVATVKRHASVLRELGALVWLVHGSKRNLRVPGRKYTATATVYGAAIPPVYDEAMGHRLSGAGYAARIVGITEAGRARAISALRSSTEPGGAEEAMQNEPADSRSSRWHAPHSLGRSPIESQVPVSGGLKDTSRTQASRSTTSSPSHNRNRIRRRAPMQVARDCRIAAQVRRMVSWTRRDTVRRLAFALRPLIDRGLGAHDIAAELHSWFLTWQPQAPAAYITARLQSQQQRVLEEKAIAGGPVGPVVPQDHADWVAACEFLRAAIGSLPGQKQGGLRLRSDADRREAVAAGRYEPRLVLDHVDDYGPDDAIDLYGAELVALCQRLRDRDIVTLGVAR